MCRVIHAQADGKGRDGPQQSDGNDEKDQYGNERAAKHPKLKSIEGIRGGTQDRVCHVRDHPEGEGTPRQDAVHRKGGGIFIRPFAAKPVTEGQVDQDQADDACPDQVACPEYISQ